MTTFSTSRFAIDGDIDAGRGQLGMLWSGVTASAPLWSLRVGANRYNIDCVAPITITLPVVGTGSSQAQPGYCVTILNTSAHNITIENDSAVVLTTILAFGYATTYVADLNSASTWTIPYNVNEYLIQPTVPGTDTQLLAVDNLARNYWTNSPIESYVDVYYDQSIVDMNGAASVQLFTAAMPDIVTNSVTYTAGLAGGFELLRSGAYRFEVTILCSTAAERTLVSIVVNGLYQGSVLSTYIPALASPQPLYLSRTVTIVAGDILQIFSEPVLGLAGPISTSADDIHGAFTTELTMTWLGHNLPPMP